jgi:lipopolysaccharide assembly protein A
VGRLLVSLLLIAAFCLGAAISYFNWTPVAFHYLAGEAELPLIALLLAAFVLGMLLMGLINLARVFTLGRERRRLARRNGELEAELRSLRNLPLGGGAASPSGPPAKDA